MTQNIHIGPAGWSYPDWNGVVYPAKPKKGFDPLAMVAFYFNLVEINSTFYRIPSQATARGWVKRVKFNPDFLITVKAFRNFTHELKPIDQAEIESFKKAVSPIYEEGILGFILIQFPWSRKFSQETRFLIDSLTKSLAPYPISVEVRHGSWGSSEAVDFIRDSGVTLCCIDQPLIGNSLSPETHFTGPAGAYFRLHGRNAAKWFDRGATRDDRYDYMYSSKELSAWSRKISETTSSTNRTVVVLNNHFRGQAVANALELKTIISNEKVPVPSTLLRVFPRLRSIASELDKEAPDSLFSFYQGELFDKVSDSREDPEKNTDKTAENRNP